MQINRLSLLSPISTTLGETFRRRIPCTRLIRITLIHNETEGNTRRILRVLYFAVEEGRKNGFPAITKGFIQERHRDIVGRVAAEA